LSFCSGFRLELGIDIQMTERTFTTLTRRLLAEKRVSGLFVQGPAEPPLDQEKKAFAAAFAGKSAKKGDGLNLPWGDWLVESLFPITLYKQNHESLLNLIRDPRVWEIAGFSGNWNNSFGRMARPREKFPKGFVDFMIERWRGKYRGMPLFYFDVEHPEWVCEPLAGRPDIPKTGRTSVSCVMNYGFHWANDTANISIVVRHMNWSHGWGDVFGAHAALQALCKELGGLPMGKVSVFANSASMDEPKIAKAYLNLLELTSES
jgi:hypothetical protein